MLSSYVRALALLLTGLLPMGLLAQTSTPTRTYTYLIYHKLAPGKTLQDALVVEREWRAVNQLAVDEGKLIGWHMMVRQMNAKSNPAEYDYVSLIVSPTPNMQGASPAAMAKLYGDSLQVRMADLQKRDRATAPVVRMEQWVTLESVFGPGFAPDKTPLVMVDFARPRDPAANWQPMVDVIKRAETERIRNNGIAGWAFSSLVVPNGSEKNYTIIMAQCMSSMDVLSSLPPLPAPVNQTFDVIGQEVFRFTEYTVRPSVSAGSKR